MPKKGEIVSLPVSAIEYVEGGHTLWVHSKEGTVLRIKCSGRITSRDCSGFSHADLMVNGDIEFCLGKKKRRR